MKHYRLEALSLEYQIVGTVEMALATMEKQDMGKEESAIVDSTNVAAMDPIIAAMPEGDMAAMVNVLFLCHCCVGFSALYVFYGCFGQGWRKMTPWARLDCWNRCWKW